MKSKFIEFVQDKIMKNIKNCSIKQLKTNNDMKQKWPSGILTATLQKLVVKKVMRFRKSDYIF